MDPNAFRGQGSSEGHAEWNRDQRIVPESGAHAGHPDQIEGDVRASLLRRRLIKKAMRFTDTHWDYAPEFDATKQYCR